ncbi:unnamed protein product [Allacma fusca]|uniref:Protein-UDP acetylgalactosaminyltransferase 7 n=1 Tax=Allacma fusca TaxID=39272 RepID=A0A8J2J9S9_9HEXA|nr:unnamed protein product [Allacma fusca]
MKTIYWHWNKYLLAIPLFIFTFVLICVNVNIGLRSKRHVRSSENGAVPFLDENKYGNFEPPEEPPGDGPGEGGKPYILPPSEENAVEVSLGKYKGICVRASDDISLTRTIPDTRPEECKYWNYPEHMGLTVSVVLVFHNEGFSTLMRNVHTILKRSPPEMIEEIILVDDCSQFEDTGGKLEKYIERFKGKVKIYRNTERAGLIRARNFGAKKSIGDVVVFLDAHCEVNRNWLPPLLAPIYHNRTTMTVPYIDKIFHKTFEYRAVYATSSLKVGIWEWGLFYKEMDFNKDLAKQRATKTEPYSSPTHAGGLFAIDRKFFEQLGYYDDGLQVWGGEQYELSFKIWQCGGSIQWVPCSRVGHIYRGGVKNQFRVPDKCTIKNGNTNYVSRNHKRVIEVWWDDKYKDYFYTREPLVRNVDHGDISKQLEFKERNKCKSFQWYMDNVAKDQLTMYPALPPNFKWGALKNVGTGTCIDSNGGPGSKPGLYRCHGIGNQLFRLNEEGQLGVGERCIDVQSVVKVIVCPEKRVDGPWEYDEEKLLLFHSRLKKCLAVNPTTKELVTRKCDANNEFCQWNFKRIGDL